MKVVLWMQIFLSTYLLVGCVAVSSTIPHSSTVNLSRKGLTEIPEEVFQNDQIKVLKLYGNQLDSLPARIGELVTLEELFLGKNNLKTLPPEIGKLKNLKILSAQYNNIASLPDEIGDLENLEQLILNQNELKTLPKTIGSLKKMEVLQLKFNQLESLPQEIGNCSELKFIYLNRNFLTEIPDSIGKLTRLKELYLANSGLLVTLPESMCSMRMLEYLEVDKYVVIPSCLLVLQANRLQLILR